MMSLESKFAPIVKPWCPCLVSAKAPGRTWRQGVLELREVMPEGCNVIVLLEDPEPGVLPEWTAAAIVIPELRPGQTVGGLKVVLTKGVVVRGRTLDAREHPLEGIEISFYSEARPRPGAAIQGTYSVQDGSWCYRFPPGQVRVYVQTAVPGCEWMDKSYDLNLEAGKIVENIDFKLKQEVPEGSLYLGKPPNLKTRTGRPGIASTG